MNEEKIDLIKVIEKYSSENVQNFQTTLSKEELKILADNIKIHLKSYKNQKDDNYIQILCNIVFIKICNLINTETVNFQDGIDIIPEMFILWDDILSYRYLVNPEKYQW